MKYVVLVPDGAADEPRLELGGKTPLAAAHTPNFDQLAQSAELGLARTIPAGFAAGSDVANLCLMGYDPNLYYTGRAPLEAASLGVDLAADQVAFRCNLVFIADGRMEDFTAGHISTGEAGELIAFLQEELGSDEAQFHPGLSYRHLMVAAGRGAEARLTPPHDITGQPVAGHLPRGEDAAWLSGLMERSQELLKNHPVNRQRQEAGKAPANSIWLWGQGRAPQMPTIQERFGIRGAVISAVDLVKGLGRYAGLEVIEVPGATGFLDTDYGAKGRYALKALKKFDFVYVHVEAPDEAAHMGDSEAKVTAIERFDAELTGPLLSGLGGLGEHRILMLPDHATPLATRTHSDAPVPYLLYDSLSAVTGASAFDEEAAAATGKVCERGWELIDVLLAP